MQIVSRIDWLLELEKDQSKYLEEIGRLRIMEHDHLELSAKMKLLTEAYANLLAKQVPIISADGTLSGAAASHFQSTFLKSTSDSKLVQELKSEIERLRGQVSLARTEIESLKTNLQHLENVESLLEKEKLLRQDAEMRIKTMEILHSPHQEEISALRQKCAQQESQSQAVQLLQIRILELEQQVASKTALELECVKAKAELERVKPYIELYRTATVNQHELLELKADRAALAARLDYESHGHREAVAKVTALESQLKLSKDDDKNRHAVSLLLEHKVQALSAENDDLRKEIHRLIHSNAEMLSAHKTLQDEVAKIKSGLKGPGHELQGEGGVVSSVLELQKLRENVRRSEEEKSKLLDEVAGLQTRLQQLEEMKTHHFVTTLTPEQSPSRSPQKK